jgi:hypothetical protein
MGTGRKREDIKLAALQRSVEIERAIVDLGHSGEPVKAGLKRANHELGIANGEIVRIHGDGEGASALDVTQSLEDPDASPTRISSQIPGD